MSIFASQTVSDPIPVPHDEGQWIQVRKLTGREEDAAALGHRNQAGSASPRAWPAIFRRLLEHGSSDAEVQKVLADPLMGYDRYEVVRAGLVAWSYPQSVKPLSPAEVVDKSRVDAIDDLDGDTVEFIAREVLRRTKPALFAATVEDVEAEKKSA